MGSRTYTVRWREGDENGSANNRDMSRLLDVMTAMEMDDDPLILINPLRYATMACVDDKDGARWIPRVLGFHGDLQSKRAARQKRDTRCFI